jgi:type IX secretion system PorP/SprF family membrane protein
MGDIRFKPDRTIFAYLGYRLRLTDDFQVEPAVLMKSSGEQTQADFSTLVRFRENIFAGVTYRGYNSETQDAIVILTGIKLSEKLSLGYAFDMTRSSLNTVSNGTHEILLNYNLNKPIGQGRPPVIIYNPRSL